MQPEPIIYVIDDDDAVRQSLEFLLRTAGHTVRGFESAKAFLEILPQLRSGCIITDVRMPDITGIDLLRRVKELGIDIPVIMITGHGDISLAVEAMKLGAVDFLEKPFDDDQLLAALRSTLSRDADLAERKAKVTEIHDKLAGLSNRRRQGAEGLGGWQRQQDHRVRSRHQPAHGRDLSRQSDDQNGGQQPVRSGAHGDGDGHPGKSRQARALNRSLDSCPDYWWRFTPRPSMKRVRICTGSRSVVPIPGLLSVRTAIKLGPPL